MHNIIQVVTILCETDNIPRNNPRHSKNECGKHQIISCGVLPVMHNIVIDLVKCHVDCIKRSEFIKSHYCFLALTFNTHHGHVAFLKCP